MRNLFTYVAGSVAALALAGTAALAASAQQPVRETALHEMTAQLPDGGVERIEYSGNVAPQVMFGPLPFTVAWPAPMGFWNAPSFTAFDRMQADMAHQMDVMFRQAQTLAAAPFAQAQGLDDAALRNMPVGASSWSMTSISTGNGVRTRTFETTIPGHGGKPQTVSHQSGDCGSAMHDSGSHAPAANADTLPIKYQTTAPATHNPRTTL